MARGNTVPVGDGSIGRSSDIHSAIGKMLEDTKSQENLKVQLRQNSSIKGLVNALLKMISRWSQEQKIRIIQEYGNMESIARNNNDIDNALVETIIINCPKSELQLIVGTEKAAENKLVNDIHKINAINRGNINASFNKDHINKTLRVTGTSTRTSFNNVVNNVANNINPTNNKRLFKALKNSTGLNIDKIFKRAGIPQLQKELTTFLRELSTFELMNECVALGLDTSAAVSDKSYINLIISKVSIYVALVLGKTKNINQIAITPAEISEIDKLLSFTSYCWITGRTASLNSRDFRERRDAAARAKKILDAHKKFKTYELKTVRKKGKIKKVYSREEIEAAIKRKGDPNLTLHFTDNMSSKQFKDFAAQLGINIPNDADSDQIDEAKDDIDQLIMSQQEVSAKTVNKSTKLLDKRQMIFDKQREAMDYLSRDPADRSLFDTVSNHIKKLWYKAAENRYTKKIDENSKEKTALQSASIDNSIRELSLGTQSYSDKIPVVTFNQSGDIISTAILNAVPVFIVNKQNVGYIKSAKQVEDDIGKESDENFIITSKKYSDNKLFINDAVIGKAKRTPKNKFKNFFKSQKVQNVINSGVYTYASKPDSTNATIDNNDFNDPTLAATRAAELALGHKLTLKMLKGKVSTFAIDMLGSTPLEHGFVDGKHNQVGAIPVIDINRSHDYISSISDTVSDMKNITGEIRDYVTQLPILFSGLQEVGTSVNTATVGAAAAYASILAGDIGSANAEMLKAYKPNAVGGKMSARQVTTRSTSLSSNVSNIITGDAPANKNPNSNNTELVTVDWNKKSLKVKPIPKLATGGTAANINNNSGISNFRNLTNSERSSPLAVGISTGIVSYNKQFSDVTDGDTKTAVKVYSINNGINEKIKIGETEMSLFDAVYGIYSTLPSILAEIGNGNKILSSIYASTSLAASKLDNINSSSSTGASVFSFPNSLNNILEGD